MTYGIQQGCASCVIKPVLSQLPLAVCTIFQNEAPFLQEWIEFHRLVGVEHFVLYDNLSDDGSTKILALYCRAGLVTLIPWPISFEEFAQARAYNDCLRQFGENFRWLALLDVDEFLLSPVSRDLPSVLEDYRDCPGIVVNWQVYGSSGHTLSPAGLVTENFLCRAPAQWVRNMRTKTILNPGGTTRVLNPHYAKYDSGVLVVNENRELVRVTLRNKAGGRRWVHYLQRVHNRLGRDLVRFFPRAPVDTLPLVVRVVALRFSVTLVDQSLCDQKCRAIHCQKAASARTRQEVDRAERAERSEVSLP